MKKVSIILFFAMMCISTFAQTLQKKQMNAGYKVGDTATDFKLQNVDGQSYSLSSFEDAKGYIMVFTSNECPFAIDYEDRLIDLHNKMEPKGYPVIAINSNDGSAGEGNTMEDMKKKHMEKDFPFVYLKDAKQDVFPKYGATKTPHVFILDKDLTVRYIGAVDDDAKNPTQVKEKYVEMAITALENGQSPDPSFTKAIGCPISSKGGKKGPRPGHKGPPSADQILEMMDKNGNGQIEKSEAHGPLTRDFDKLDTNGDGKLTKEELSKLKGKR